MRIAVYILAGLAIAALLVGFGAIGGVLIERTSHQAANPRTAAGLIDDVPTHGDETANKGGVVSFYDNDQKPCVWEYGAEDHRGKEIRYLRFWVVEGESWWYRVTWNVPGDARYQRDYGREELSVGAQDKLDKLFTIIKDKIKE